MHLFKDPDIHEIERSCPTQEVASTNVTPQILASTASEGTLADREKAFMQSDPSVRDEPLYATPPSEGLPGVPQGAQIRLDREVYGLVSGMSGWRSRIFSELLRGRLRDEYLRCLIVSLLSARNRQSTEAQSHLESLLVVCCSRWRTTFHT